MSVFTTLFKKQNRKENKVHVYSIGQSKVTNNKKNQELIYETLAQTAHKLNSLGYPKNLR